MSANVGHPDSGSEGVPWIVVGGAFLGLTLLLRLPALLAGLFPADPAFYWEGPLRVFSLDLFALFSLLAFFPPSSAGRILRSFVVGSVFFLFAYETYAAAVVSILQRNPILYADVSHLVGTFYLLLNAIPTWIFLAGLLGGVMAVALLGWGLPRVIERAHHCIHATNTVRRGVLVANLVVWPLVAFAAVTFRGIERQTYQEVCLSTTECVAYNLRASANLRANLADRMEVPPDSTYANYWDLEWTTRPSLYLIVMESYGMSLSTSSSTRASYDRLMTRVTDSLGASGWHTATTQSRAPVFGGLSWLSVASILLGTSIDHQPTFEAHLETLPRYPHLVRLLQDQGYETGLLQPPVRARPGLQVENSFGFEHTFYLQDLNYRGPDDGWGIVPDQHSLSVAHDEFVERTDEPVFLLFEMVSSHGPWNRPPPPLVNNPAALNQSTTPIRALSDTIRSGTGPLGLPRTVRYPDALSRPQRFFRHIRYDWRVLTDYLRTDAPPNSLVIVLGDHQPFFAETTSLATPLHVLSRDRRLVRRFERQGFTPGLHPSGSAESLHHAALYSLLVRTVTAHDRAKAGPTSNDPLPPFRPTGVERAALLPENRP